MATIVASLTPAPTAPPSPPKSDEMALFDLLNQGAIDQAIAMIRHWPAKPQQQARKLLRHTAASLLQDRYAQAAIHVMAPYYHQWPQDLPARLLLARAELLSQQFQSVIDILLEADRLTTDTTQLQQRDSLLHQAIHRLDALLRQHDRRNDLLTLYRQLIAHDGANSNYQLQQVRLLIEMGQLAEAAIQLQPLLYDVDISLKAKKLQQNIDRQLARTFTDTITLTRLGNHFLVPVEGGGQTLMLLLDTGASLTMVPQSLISVLPQPVKQGRVRMVTASGTTTMATTRLPLLRLGHQQMHDIPVALTTDIGIDQADGLLGMDILKHFDFIIDQEHATLRLTPRQQ
ncbi:MAG: retropepsin-like aspartic protease [Mariprofundales bacterium]